MATDKAAEARRVAAERQARITNQWQEFATKTGREAYADLMQYMDGLMGMYLKYCEDQAMPHPTNPTEVVPITNNMIASLLQARRGCGMVKTYISNRVDTDVAQSIKSTK